MPNWIGSTPSSRAIGRKIGVQIKMSAAMSMIMPSSSKITLIIRRTTQGFSEMVSMNPS